MFLKLALLLCFALHNLVNGFIEPGGRKWCHGNDDPHMKSFDDRFYEFQRSGRYILFTNKVDLTVSGGFAPCNVGSTARCGCGLAVRYQNSVLRYDRCSVAPAPSLNQFYYDTISATSVPVDCFANTVPVADETNDVWWNTPGNPVDVDGKFQCAKLESSNTIVIRTNTGNDAANVYVKATIHTYGMYSIEIGITNYYWQNTAGLCGFYDGDQGNDFFTDNGVFDPNVPSDFDIVADFWSLKIDGDLFETLDNIYCPCDQQKIRTKRALAVGRFECQVPIAACTLQQQGEPVTFQEAILPDEVQEVLPDDAEAKCRESVDNQLFAHQQDGLLTDQEIDVFLQNCINDLVLTGDQYWTDVALRALQDKADQRNILRPQFRDAWCWSHDDPHMKTFDDFAYEFQVAGSYVLFTNGINMAVQATFSPCSYNTAVTCNCGVRVAYIDTALRFDRCTVAPNPSIMKFYADTPFGSSIEINCGAKSVSPSDLTNDAWWNDATNPVNVNGRISCARIGSSNGYMIRTNTGFDAANVYVKLFLHPNGIYSIDIKVTTFYWRRTGGLCGFFDGNPKNDFFTDDGVFDPNSPKELQIVANFWSLKYPSFNFYDQLSCLCDRESNNGIIKTKCDIPIAQCTLIQIGANFTKQEVVRDFYASQMNPDEAVKLCKGFVANNKFNEAAQFGLLTTDEVRAFYDACVQDLTNTADTYWPRLAAAFTQDLVDTRLDTINSKIKYAWCWSHDDPHMKTFDDKYYEFQLAGSYLLFSNGLNMAVQASFTPCTYNTAVTCNCGIRVVYLDTTLRFDRCGVAPNSVIMQFFADTPFNTSIPTNCAAKSVSAVDETNDSWWNVAGHAVNVNGRISCAKLSSATNGYMIRTNTGINAANIYVKVFTHDLGLYSIDIRVSSFYYQKTRGLCGYYDDNPNNDFFTDKGVFDTVKDLQTVADYWRLKYPAINVFEQLYCPCDGPIAVDALAKWPVKTKCDVPIAQCTLRKLGVPFELQDVLRAVKGVASTEAIAKDQCSALMEKSEFNEAVQKGWLSQNDLNVFLQNCILDYLATSDIFFGEKAVDYVKYVINNQWENSTQSIKYAWCWSHDDPHMKTFDDYYYEFHKTGRYILFTNRNDITVAGAFRPCNPSSSVTCNCGFTVRYLDTTLGYDRCGAVPVPASTIFYARTPSGFLAINCDAKIVSSSDETNDGWWNTPGNAVNVNGRVLCARVGSTGYYMIRTNTGYNFKNVYVKAYIHAYGAYSVDVRVSSYYYGRLTGGLCGLYNGNTKDDLFIYNSLGRVVATTDLNTVASYWSLKNPSIGNYDRLDCASCNATLNSYLANRLISAYECSVPIAQCTFNYFGIKYEKRNEVRNVVAIPTTLTVAQAYCQRFFTAYQFKTAVQNGYLTEIEYSQYLQYCINDYMSTGDGYWTSLLISYMIDVIKSRTPITPVTITPITPVTITPIRLTDITIIATKVPITPITDPTPILVTQNPVVIQPVVIQPAVIQKAVVDIAPAVV